MTAWTSVVSRADLPVVVICHNQLRDLTALLGWLERCGHERILLLDNASTYPPLLSYYDASPHEVIRLGANLGQQAPWISGLIDEIGSSAPFAVTDPDVVPDPSCPTDAVEYFQSLLLRFPLFSKAGFGLHIDDLPERYPHRNRVRQWETPFWSRELAPGVFAAHIDTTFAVYRPGTPYKVTESLRTGFPYLARHAPWYRDPRCPDEEDAFYFRHRRPDVGYWNRLRLPTVVTKQDHLARRQ
jgi:hypothetical protein